MHIPELCRYLAELADNNERPWFLMNKPRYDILRAEFLELVTELIANIARFDPEIAQCDPKKALFRINRDVRFGADKSPYKTTFSAALTPHGRKKPSEGGGPAYYFQINAQGNLLCAVGEYIPPADRLKIIRQHIVSDASGFSKLIKNKKLKERYGNLQEEGKLVRPPKGYDADHLHIEYLKLKSMMVWAECPVKGMVHADLKQHISNSFKDAYPLVTWLRAA